jgi:hypothetical protein
MSFGDAIIGGRIPTTRNQSPGLLLAPKTLHHARGHFRLISESWNANDGSTVTQCNPIGGTLANCDPFGTPSTSHWTGAAIFVQSPRTKNASGESRQSIRRALTQVVT